jgi:hypothetical protein
MAEAQLIAWNRNMSWEVLNLVWVSLSQAPYAFWLIL